MYVFPIHSNYLTQMYKNYLIPFLIFFTSIISHQLVAQNKKETIKIQQEKIDSFYRATDSITKVFESEKSRLMTLNATLESELKTQQALVQTLTTQKSAQEGTILYLEKKDSEHSQKINAQNTSIDSLKDELVTIQKLLDEKNQLLTQKDQEIELYKSSASTTNSDKNKATDEFEIESGICGVYQLMTGSRGLKGKDVGEKKNANDFMFVVLFSDGTAYSLFASALSAVNKANVYSMISAGKAVRGEYSFNGHSITMQFKGQERLTVNYDESRKSFIYDYGTDTRIMFRNPLK
jgi:hypothetical protein